MNRNKNHSLITLLLVGACALALSCAEKSKTEDVRVASEERTVAAGSSVGFEDAKLQILVWEAIGKSSGDLHASELLGLTRLDVANKGIASLSGIEHIRDLEYLDLNSNYLRDVRPLAALKSLTDLKLSSNYVTDISALSGLGNLQTLDLSKNQITDVSPLRGLSRLSALDLSNNHVSDLSALSGLTALKRLNLNNNQITDLTPLMLNSDAGGLGPGAEVHIKNNSLDYTQILNRIPHLEGAGAKVYR